MDATLMLMDAVHYAIEIIKKLSQAGYIAYFAGGWVRDHLMEHPSTDIDIATNAPPEKILDLFPQTILVGLAFGVVVVSIDGHQFEVATFRKDFGYSDGRKPDRIEFSDAREDALRRDFTINGMFYDPIEHVIHDYVQGVDDLQKGLIRAIGNPYERFLEDRLRMIRAVRFASRFAFAIDTETQEAIIANADLLFPAVAMERIWAEFKKMSAAPRFDHALIELHRLGLLPVIFPRLQGLHLNEIKARTAAFNDFPQGTPAVLYLCQLFPKASLEELQDIFRQFHVSNQELKLIEAMVQARIYFLDDRQDDPCSWAYFYAQKHTPLLIEVEAARRQKEERKVFLDRHNKKRTSLATHIERLATRKPIVTAFLLKACGIPQGTAMGVLLKEAERLAINQDLNDPDVILEQLQQHPLWRSVD